MRCVWFRYATPAAPLVQEVVVIIMVVVPRPPSMAQPVTARPARVGWKRLIMSMAWAISTSPWKRRWQPDCCTCKTLCPEVRKNFAPSNPFWQNFCNRVLKLKPAGMIFSSVRWLVHCRPVGQCACVRVPVAPETASGGMS